MNLVVLGFEILSYFITRKILLIALDKNDPIQLANINSEEFLLFISTMEGNNTRNQERMIKFCNRNE